MTSRGSTAGAIRSAIDHSDSPAPTVTVEKEASLCSFPAATGAVTEANTRAATRGAAARAPKTRRPRDVRRRGRRGLTGPAGRAMLRAEALMGVLAILMVLTGSSSREIPRAAARPGGPPAEMYSEHIFECRTLQRFRSARLPAARSKTRSNGPLSDGTPPDTVSMFAARQSAASDIGPQGPQEPTDEGDGDGR